MSQPNKLPVKGDGTGPCTTARVVEAVSPIVEDLGPVVLSGPSGVVFNVTSSQLHCNLTVLGAGDSIASHVNDDVDVLLIVLSGSGTLVLNGDRMAVVADVIAMIPRGWERSIEAKTRLTYHSIHQRA